MYGGVRGRKTKVGEKLHRFPPTRFPTTASIIPQTQSHSRVRWRVL